MTPETKLGLLIGGAFILCFSLILSSAQDGLQAERELAAITLTSQSPPTSRSMAGGRIPLEDFVPDIHSSRSPRHAGLASSAVVDSPGPTLEFASATPQGQTVIAHESPLSETGTRQSPSSPQTPPRSTGTDALANTPDSESSDQDHSEGEFMNLESSNLPDVIDEVEAPRGRSTPTPRRVQTYEVAGGDNLTKIARRFYGDAGQADIQRIWKANRDVLATPDALRAGQRIVIPTIDQPSSAPQASPKRTRDDAPTKHRWYQIQDHDRYSTIASSELGTAKRWKEIFEMNKDRFPNPDQIRPGVRIRLPLQ